jgi:murein DD-endopeptidase MepM/ murein hydrolase activator NlpD
MRLPVNNPEITSGYGKGILNGKERFHDGIDFVEKNRQDTRVFSPFSGKVIYAFKDYKESERWTNPKMSGGNLVIIEYWINSVKCFMRFVHLITNVVQVNKEIKESDLIGNYGDVGYSFGSHLHNDLYDISWKKLNIEEFYKSLNLL